MTEANQQFASELAELSGGIGGGMKELQAKLAMKHKFGRKASEMHAPQGVSLASAAKSSSDGLHRLLKVHASRDKTSATTSDLTPMVFRP